MHFVVGIGASAGGLDALEKFFEHMPVRSDVSFVVVQHLSPDFKSMMGELLSRRTVMPVIPIEEGMAIAPGVVYLNPPRMHLTMAGGKLFPKTYDVHQHPHLPIDVFFQSLAEDQGARAVGIVLSGTGMDGTDGIRAIKEHEGLVLVQREESARFDGMPHSAIQTGVVDLVLLPEEMGDKLAAYIEISLGTLESGTGENPDSDRESLAQILKIIRKTMGLDLSHYKLPTIHRRVERRMNLHRMWGMAEYVSLLQDNREEVERLYHDLLIGVTRFFRDPEAFAHLSAVVIPEILKSRKNGESVRIWVTACSTGEEAYSIGILFRECMRMSDITADIRIFATDIDRKVVEYAGAGRYPEGIAADVPVAFLNRYFVREGSRYRICKEVREMIVFAEHNLIKDPPFNNTDLICCRNMLIYLQPALQHKVIAQFDYSLETNGYLFLGPSESIGGKAHAFLPVENRWKIYRHRERVGIAGQGREPYMQKTDPIWKNREQPSAQFLKSQSIGMEKETGMKEQLYRILLQMHVGPSVIVDENGNTLLILGGATRYLNVADGIPSPQLDHLLERNAALAIRTAMDKVFREPVQSRFQYVKHQPDGSEEWVEVSVEAMPEGLGSGRLALIRFAGLASPAAAVQDIEPLLGKESLERIVFLEQELQDSRDALRETIEALEASNEELLSSNEELQSTNEELHSVNRELISFNADYQARITELMDLNDDMENFLGNTRIGTLFLDRNYCIRKFTQAVRRVINLMEQDIGRPIGHLSHKLANTNILTDCRFVLETLTPVKKLVTSEVGTVYLMDIMPYRTRANQVKGVVASFIDITDYQPTS